MKIISGCETYKTYYNTAEQEDTVEKGVNYFVIVSVIVTMSVIVCLCLIINIKTIRHTIMGSDITINTDIQTDTIHLDKTGIQQTVNTDETEES